MTKSKQSSSHTGRMLKAVKGGRMTSIVFQRQPRERSTAESTALRSRTSKAGQTRYS